MIDKNDGSEDENYDTNGGSGSENLDSISFNNDDQKDYLKPNTIIETFNLFDDRIDDCSKTKWIPYYDVHIDPLRFSDSVSICNIRIDNKCVFF